MKVRLAAFAALVVLALSSHADDGIATDDSAPNAVSLSHFYMLQTDMVRKELKLTGVQTIGVTLIRSSFVSAVEDLGNKYLDLPEGKRDASALRGQVYEAARLQAMPKIEKLLTAQQFVRLKQMFLSGLGGGIFRDEEFTRSLNLTRDQQSEIDKVWNERLLASEAAHEQFQVAIDRQMSQEEIDAASKKSFDNYFLLLRQSFDASIKHLNPEQHRKVDELVGEPIDSRALAEQVQKLEIEVMISRDLPNATHESLMIQVGDGGNFGVSGGRSHPIGN